MEFEFYFPYPQAVSKAKRDDGFIKYHRNKPDISNLIKFYEDIGTGILYRDDCIIAYEVARKCYDDSPRTEFVITEI